VTTNELENNNILITDVNGRILLRLLLSSKDCCNSVNLEGFSNGIYFISSPVNEFRTLRIVKN
jgi:hypothetical protein